MSARDQFSGYEAFLANDNDATLYDGLLCSVQHAHNINVSDIRVLLEGVEGRK